MNIYEHSLDYWKQHLNEALDAKKKSFNQASLCK